MFARTLFTVLLLTLSATQWPTLATRVHDMLDKGDVGVDERGQLASASAGGQTVLAMGKNGHYNGTFRMNGKAVDAMVDTGASLIAINVSTARRLGFPPSSLDFKHSAETANGRIKAAHVVLERVEIGSVRVRDVDAFVLEDAALSSTLVGMSFLSKLKSYTADKRSLRLVQ
ncbi:TIGR02281 family clan AA aspartic protease [Peteryoungia ipomoeae]|uniref:TIGR02281 family clan AA aspartic protease n=1 Tax=Peteryoungia ipomoeae TaxID=1210932 RepID=A0A4V4HMZ4_9HYPH|nr:TIGR02281 family clan AA aspartic protease [Peteryoungia ipomoeae]THV24066.1 TIGR02281 family clan AA aspartic protease [Peteryoungia ipomoeae]